MCENSDGWLVAWGLCEYMLTRSSTAAVWFLPFSFLKLQGNCATALVRMPVSQTDCGADRKHGLIRIYLRNM